VIDDEDDAKHPCELSDAEAEAVVDEFDAGSDYLVTGASALAERRAPAAARRKTENRNEAAALRAHRDGASWGVIGAPLGMTRQGARQRFERLTRS
jgi:hypothetical protein